MNWSRSKRSGSFRSARKHRTFATRSPMTPARRRSTPTWSTRGQIEYGGTHNKEPDPYMRPAADTVNDAAALAAAKAVMDSA